MRAHATYPSPLRPRCVLLAYDLANVYIVAACDDLASRTAWGTPFVGEYHKYLYKWIMDVKAGKTSSRSSGPYRNILPIIQSSGTGKSRLAHEVASLIFTLPLNVHGRLENKSSGELSSHNVRE